MRRAYCRVGRSSSKPSHTRVPWSADRSHPAVIDNHSVKPLHTERATIIAYLLDKRALTFCLRSCSSSGVWTSGSTARLASTWWAGLQAWVLYLCKVVVFEKILEMSEKFPRMHAEKPARCNHRQQRTAEAHLALRPAAAWGCLCALLTLFTRASSSPSSSSPSSSSPSSSKLSSCQSHIGRLGYAQSLLSIAPSHLPLHLIHPPLPLPLLILPHQS